jgi:hypothetical protein
MAKTKTVGKKRSAQHNRKMLKSSESPPPRQQIERQQKSVQGCNFGFGATGSVVE